MIIRDEDGTERLEATTPDEQLAINAGGRYEWTDRDGVRHVTEVTPEGTRRSTVDPDAGVASASFARHERRESSSGTGSNGADSAFGIADGVLSGVLPYVPALGLGPRYYDPGYVVPGYVVPVNPGYASGVGDAALIPGTAVAGSGGTAGTTDQAQRRFTRRLLHVKNNTAEPITVYVQFRSPTEGGEWSWLPADPATSPDALAFELGAGEEGYLDHHGAPISASRVRIWGQSAARQWATYQNADLWLVSEVDGNGERAYFAAEMETYPFTFE